MRLLYLMNKWIQINEYNVGCVCAGKLQTQLCRVRPVDREMVERALDGEPPMKKHADQSGWTLLSCRDHWASSWGSSAEVQLKNYLDTINSPAFNADTKRSELCALDKNMQCLQHCLTESFVRHRAQRQSSVYLFAKRTLNAANK